MSSFCSFVSGGFTPPKAPIICMFVIVSLHPYLFIDKLKGGINAAPAKNNGSYSTAIR